MIYSILSYVFFFIWWVHTTFSRVVFLFSCNSGVFHAFTTQHAVSELNSSNVSREITLPRTVSHCKANSTGRCDSLLTKSHLNCLAHL